MTEALSFQSSILLIWVLLVSLCLAVSEIYYIKSGIRRTKEDHVTNLILCTVFVPIMFVGYVVGLYEMKKVN